MQSMNNIFRVQGSVCCGYGTDVMKTSGYDCATIPGAVKNTNDMKVVAERICGRQFVVTHEGTGAKATTICSEFTFFE